MNDGLRWSLGVLVALIAAFIILYNLRVLLFIQILPRYSRRRPKYESWVPLLGGLLGACAFFTLPIPSLKQWFWLPLVLDWGSIPGIAYTLIWYLFFKPKTAKQSKDE